MESIFHYCLYHCHVPGSCFDLTIPFSQTFPLAQLKHGSLKEYKEDLDRKDRLTPIVREAISRAENVRVPICYIAGPLTEATEEQKLRYEIAAKLCEGYGWFGYAPHLYGTDPKKHPEVKPEEVRDIDYLWAVIMPTFHLNFFSPTAHGNAMELGWAEVAGIPTIGFIPEAARVSRLLRGARNLLILTSYEEGNMEVLVQNALKDIHEWQEAHEVRFLMGSPRLWLEGYFARIAFRRGLIEFPK